MDAMYKISVIIPVYNSENYLGDTIQSVINQTIGFENIELLLIDDNSTDNSRIIIDEYSKKYDNVVPIFLEDNHGFPGYGRNVGINKSTSEFIMFLDNDDEYNPEICEKLYETIVETDADLVDCRFDQIDYLSTITSPRYDFNIKPEDIVYYGNINIWTKIFKRSMLVENDIKFITDGLNEDSLFSIEYFLNIEKLISIDYIGYKHFIRGDNLSTVTFDYIYGILLSYYKISNLLKDEDYNLNRIFGGRISITIERTIVMADCNFKSIEKVFRELHRFEHSENFHNISLESPILNRINNLILDNNISVAVLIIYILNKFSRIKFLKRIYRKQH